MEADIEAGSEGKVPSTHSVTADNTLDDLHDATERVPSGRGDESLNGQQDSTSSAGSYIGSAKLRRNALWRQLQDWNMYRDLPLKRKLFDRLTKTLENAPDPEELSVAQKYDLVHYLFPLRSELDVVIRDIGHEYGRSWTKNLGLFLDGGTSEDCV